MDVTPFSKFNPMMSTPKSGAREERDDMDKVANDTAADAGPVAGDPIKRAEAAIGDLPAPPARALRITLYRLGSMNPLYGVARRALGCATAARSQTGVRDGGTVRVPLGALDRAPVEHAAAGLNHVLVCARRAARRRSHTVVGRVRGSVRHNVRRG